jgi:protein-tyrosine phosphatase
MPVRNLLYVCTANIFRSRVAEELTKQLLEDSKMKINVESAGIQKYNGEPLRKELLDLTKRYKIDMSAHAPKQVNARLVNKADLILVFDDAQLRELGKKFPSTKNKTYTIKDYVGCTDYSTEDLWGKPVELFEGFIKETKLDIQKCLDRIGGRQ